jgi:hypothetical protein
MSDTRFKPQQVKEWYINKCQDSKKYMFGIGNEPLFSGTYTQCLIILGGLSSGMSLELATKLANEIPDTVE